MLKYVIKRILIFIPTLFAITLITFIISVNTPGDPVATMLNQSIGTGTAMSATKLANEKSYVRERHRLGLDLPLFYFYVTNQTYPDTLYRIAKPEHRETLADLAYKYGDWQYIAQYYQLINKLDITLFQIKATHENSQSLSTLRNDVNYLYHTSKETEINTNLNNIQFILDSNHSINDEVGAIFGALKVAFATIIQEQNPYAKYVPKFIWYGTHNQYHVWLFGDKPWFSSDKNVDWRSTGVIRGDFGVSYKDRRPVSDVLWDALQWTIMISLLSIIIAYVVAIPLGIYTAIKKGTLREKTISGILFALYSLPNFWIGTLLIIYFCGAEHLGWFPPAFSIGKLPASAPFWSRFFDTLYRLILPVICISYGSFAFISRQMRSGMLNSINQDFIRTARAKGLSENKVIWKHALRNSLIPIITLFASIFPLAIAGSVVIELIFSIPGAGKLTLDAIFSRNYPIVYTVLLFTGILTLVGTLVSDILYAFVDPRISFSSKK